MNEKYFTQTYSADISYTFPKNFILSTDFRLFTQYRPCEKDITKAYHLWNASLSKQLFKKKNGELKFSVNDILNQNQSITRNNRR